MKNFFDLTGRTYLVTGAASGMGRATSLLLSECGAKIILVDINEEGLKSTASLCQTDTCNLVLDLSQPETFKDRILEAVDKIGKLSGFVHCAGIPYITPLKVVNAEKADLVYKINSYAAIELTKVFASKKIYAGENGSIVFISSVYGVVGSAACVGYAMSKGAVQSATRALAMELAPRKIRVNCIAPGFVKSNMMNENTFRFDEDYMKRLDAMHPLGLGTPEDIAKSIVFLFSDMSKWITGTIMNVDGGFTAQ
jgi:NAD(P)-dependent dehydrogenase (short-subunit alcohol dehydrogenase family)